MARLFVGVCLLAISVSSCRVESAPVAFYEQMLREAWGLPTTQLHAPDRSFATEVVGSLLRPAEELADGSGVSMSIDVGSQRPVECFFFTDDVDLATTIRALAEKAMADSAGVRGPIRFKRVHKVDAGNFDVSPFFAVEWIYAIGVDRLHDKHRIASRDGRAIYCRHLEVGYSESFARMFERLVRNFRVFDRSRVRPYYSSVVLSRIDGRPVGVERTVLTGDGEDGVRIRRRASTLKVIDGSSSLVATDTMRVAFATRDGTLINSVYARSDNGMLVTNLSLDPAGEGWLIGGTLEGRSFKAEMDGVALSSLLGAALSLRKALRDHGPGASAELQVWSPSVEPAEPVTLAYRVVRERDDGHFDVTSTLGAITRQGVVDVTGEAKSERVIREDEEVELEELYRVGSF